MMQSQNFVFGYYYWSLKPSKTLNTLLQTAQTLKIFEPVQFLHGGAF